MGNVLNCCEESESESESENEVEEPRTRGLHKDTKNTLKIGVWNAASGDEKFRLEAKDDEAAKFFADTRHDIVICPEGSNAGKAFEEQGYTLVKGSFGLRAFYDAKTLEAKGKTKIIKMIGGVGKGNRDGTAVGQMLQDLKSKETVLLVGVHAGHYGNSDTLVQNGHYRRNGKWSNNDAMRNAAWKTMDDLHNSIRDMIKSSHRGVDKVVVGGDFNELGALIAHDQQSWKPLPDEIPHQFGSIHVRDTLTTTHVTADHIWVGGTGVHFRSCRDKKTEAFGSDHMGLSVWGV